MTTKEKIEETVGKLKGSGIYGCITGSCLLDADFDEWDEAPDVDVFVYSENALVHAIDVLRYKYGFEPGTLDPRTEAGEQWKIERNIRFGNRRNAALSTVKMNDGEVVVNVSWKKNQTTVLDVISAFDMSIIMRGYDIQKGTDLDLRCMASTPDVAVPNPLRDQDADVYTVSQWLRQFDRVIKYWNRGFDTRPMAAFYLQLITEVLRKGSLFETEKSKAYFDEFAEEFVEIREKIEAWLKDKED